MKRTSKVIQWALAALFAICALGNGLHYSSIFLVLAAVLIMPIKPIRDALEKAKLKTWLIIVLAIIIFFVGMMLSPRIEVDPNDDFVTETTESIDAFSESSSANTPSADTSSTDTSTGVGTTTPTLADPSKLPAYSGTPYVVVNNNIPSFNATELTTTAYESYSSLDTLGRCGMAVASCGTEIMPADNEERGSISSITPSGWIQAQYDCVSGRWLYNRSHLIGWQLSAENANARNLITGTKYLNVEGMLPFENMVADYIKETGNHVAYRVTPIFEGNNLLCSGVQMEAYSVEDNGDGICFNVYCYNIQPGVTIDYVTGASMLNGSSDNNNNNNSNNNESTGTTYVLNTNSKKFHYPSCSSAEAIGAGNRDEYTGNREWLINQGYSPCGRCDP